MATQIRPMLDAHEGIAPAILEIPSKEHPYNADLDPIHRRTKLLLGVRD